MNVTNSSIWVNVTNSSIYLHPNATTIQITVISCLDCCGHLILTQAWLFLDNLLLSWLSYPFSYSFSLMKGPTASCSPGTLPLFSITKKSLCSSHYSNHSISNIYQAPEYPPTFLPQTFQFYFVPYSPIILSDFKKWYWRTFYILTFLNS